MRSISATLRMAGHRTTMIFAGAGKVPVNDLMMREITTVAKDSGIIGISSMSRGSARAKKLIAGLRPLGKLIVWGGMHPTLFPGDCIGHADLVCRGEGEEFMVELAERVSSGKDWRDIPNGACLSEGQPVTNDLRPLIPDLDRLPLLDFAFGGEFILDPSGALVPNEAMRNDTKVLFSGSRGCSNSCTYCSNSRLKSIYHGKGPYVRRMSVARFVEVAGEYRRMFPRADHFYFTDEDFFARPVEEMREFAETYPCRVGVPFECMASPRQITEEKVALAARAGMAQVDVGLESGSERVRHEVFHRHIDDETQLRAAAALATHSRGKVVYFLILGNPYEDRDDLIGGVRLLEQMPAPFFLRAYNLVFIPGTRLFDRACEDGIIGGMDESAFEINFIGFDHRNHDWKRKNLYLNSLLYLMHGHFSDSWAGRVPRSLVPVLASHRMAGFCETIRVGDVIMATLNLHRGMRTTASTLYRKVAGSPVRYGN